MAQPVILVAEDEAIIGLDLCATVGEAGYTVEGPHGDTSSALLACEKQRPDVAILDVELADGAVYPLAEKLIAQDIPVIFHSGVMTPNEVGERFPNSPALAKPCPPDRMIESVQKALGQV